MKKTKIKLYDYLMSLLRFCNKNDSIVIKSDTFCYEYDNIYKILDEIHLVPGVKYLYKDYKVYNVLITSNHNGNHGNQNIKTTFLLYNIFL